MTEFIVDFDYRSDLGPKLVGTFSSRESASEWVARQLISEASWECIALAKPEEGS